MAGKKAPFLLMTLIGCLNRSPEAAMLAPIAAQFARGSFDEGSQPIYLRFADPATASVFKHVNRGGRYRIAPPEAALVCPSNPAAGLHGYVLSARVDNMMGDSAIASISRTCLDPQRAIVTGEHILLTRQRGKWKIEKILDGFTTIPM